MLFLELALIRWLGANVIHLSYFSNFVLLGSFLGIGAGFLISRKSWSIWPASMPLLSILVVGVLWFPVTIERTGSDVIYFTSLETSGPPAWLALPIIFAMVAVVLAGPAEVVGRCFGKLPPLTAYRYDLIGSFLGICAFTALSFLHAPSVAWGFIAFILYLALTSPSRRLVTCAWALMLVGKLLQETLAPGVSWSPYYKVATKEVDVAGSNLLLIGVNGVPHQLMAPAKWKLEQGEGIYRTPYLRLPANPLEDVLIIGAGSGSDVAIALSKQARHVDAVDIDPRILQIGVEQNPDRPYADKRVKMHTNDGRAFLESTDRKYDLILFALPDSLTLVSGASQIRLEVIPVYAGSAGVRARAPETQRRLRDVQLLSRALAHRQAGRNRRYGIRARAMRRHIRRCASGHHHRDDGRRPALRNDLDAGIARWRDCSGNRQFAVSLLQGRLVPCRSIRLRFSLFS